MSGNSCRFYIATISQVFYTFYIPLYTLQVQLDHFTTPALAVDTATTRIRHVNKHDHGASAYARSPRDYAPQDIHGIIKTMPHANLQHQRVHLPAIPSYESRRKTTHQNDPASPRRANPAAAIPRKTAIQHHYPATARGEILPRAKTQPHPHHARSMGASRVTNPPSQTLSFHVTH